MLAANKTGYIPYTPATNLLYGLHETLEMLMEEGPDNVFARHDRHCRGDAPGRAGLGLEILCSNPAEYSSALTAIPMPTGHDADQYRNVTLQAFDQSLGAGLSKLAGKVFRIGHLGSFNDLMLMGTLCGVEMGLSRAGAPHRRGGAQAAMDYLTAPRAAAVEGGHARSVA